MPLKRAALSEASGQQIAAVCDLLQGEVQHVQRCTAILALIKAVRPAVGLVLKELILRRGQRVHDIQCVCLCIEFPGRDLARQRLRGQHRQIGVRRQAQELRCGIDGVVRDGIVVFLIGVAVRLHADAARKKHPLLRNADMVDRPRKGAHAAALRIGQRNGGHDAERRRVERGGEIELRSGHGLAFGIVADLRHGGCAPACLVKVRRSRGNKEQQAVCRADALVKAVLRERAQQGRCRRLRDVIQPQMAHVAAAQVTVHRRSRRHNGKPVALHEQGVGEFIGILRGRSR